MNVWSLWAKQNNVNEDIASISPENLNSFLERFYAEVKTKNGEDYEPDSLRVMIVAIDRFLKDKGYKLSIIRDREFSSSKQVLE